MGQQDNRTTGLQDHEALGPLEQKTMGNGRWRVGDRQWAMGNCRWAMD